MATYSPATSDSCCSTIGAHQSNFSASSGFLPEGLEASMILAKATTRHDYVSEPRPSVTFRRSGLKREHEIETIPADLWTILRRMVRNPVQSIAPPWSWKAAIFSSVLRASTFFAINLRGGRQIAIRAMIVEAAYAIFAAGLVGAVSQQLRKARPLWATLSVVLLGLPGIFVLGQSCVHRAAHTPHVAGGLLVSFLLTSLSSGFSWYAMRHGAMLGGTEDTTILHDFKALPAIFLGFLQAVPRAIQRKFMGLRGQNKAHEPGFGRVVSSGIDQQDRLM
jgi:hypothetical protein